MCTIWYESPYNLHDKILFRVVQDGFFVAKLKVSKALKKRKRLLIALSTFEVDFAVIATNGAAEEEEEEELSTEILVDGQLETGVYQRL